MPRLTGMGPIDLRTLTAAALLVIVGAGVSVLRTSTPYPGIELHTGSDAAADTALGTSRRR